MLASTGHDRKIKLWDVASGTQLRSLGGHSTAVTSAAFSPDGRLIAGGGSDGSIKLWHAASPIRLLDVIGNYQWRSTWGDSGAITSVAFSPDGRVLASGSSDAKTILWDTTSGQELASLISLDESEWAVVTGDGRYDASVRAMELMHWVVGKETISLSQLKERYFEPNLLPKLLGYNNEPMRNVTAFAEVRLYPAVSFEAPPSGSTKLNLTLTDRGGGVGRIQVFVNEKEVAEDARSNGMTRAAQTTLSVDLAAAPFVPGHPNEIRVVAWNEEGYISGPGEVRTWIPVGEARVVEPQLYAVIVGVSNYSSPNIRLRYPDKDAADFAKAIGLGAKKLFGADRARVTLLNTSGQEGTTAPTKANLNKAFAEIARRATPSDIFVLYMAGHGTGKAGSDTYFFLTQEARGFSDLEDPAVRAQVSVSSKELAEWVKAIPALKQIMVLDTCAAGQAAAALVERRSVSADQIRAIERLKDRTGFHILMGSAADSVSYEANKYGQGLLTYALLEGMRGAALNNGEYVDVSKLFQYAADKMPRLARDIGGVQQPRVSAPRGTSFDIGRLEVTDRELIPLAQVKPLVLRPVLINPDEGTDNLGLMTTLRKALNDESFVESRGLLGGGRGPAMIYIDADEMPGASRPSGTYTVAGGKVSVRLFLTRDGRKVGPLLVEGEAADHARLVKRLTSAIKRAVVQEK